MKVFPAGAGVIPFAESIDYCAKGFPRRCGGDPNEDSFSVLRKEFSPQVRG